MSDGSEPRPVTQQLHRSESIKELVAAMVKAQLEMKPAIKDSENPHFKSKYADLASVWEALEPFRRNGIAIIQRPMPFADGMIGLETQLLHTSGEWMSGVMETPIVKHDPQGVGSAITYLRRYSLGCMTGLVTEEDDDGNAASHAPQQQAHRPAAAQVMQQKREASQKINDLRTAMPDDPTTPYRHRLRSLDTAAQIQAWYRSIPEELKQDLYNDYTLALNKIKVAG